MVFLEINVIPLDICSHKVYLSQVMCFSMHKNKIIALSRWNNYRLTQREHLSKIKNTWAYHILRARLHGYICGDGSLRLGPEKGKSNAIRHDVSIYPDDEVMLHKILECIWFLYKVNIRVDNCNNYYKVSFSSQVACENILELGKIGTYDWSIPNFSCK